MRWLCNHIQTAIFLADESKINGHELWNAMSLPQAGMYFKEGMVNPMNYPGELLGSPYNDFSIILGFQRRRIDLWVTPAGNAKDTPATVPHLNDAEEALRTLNEKSSALFDNIDCNRIGIVAELGKFCDNQKTSTKLFLEEIKATNAAPPDAFELAFKYNRTTKECFSGYEFFLNRIISTKTFKTNVLNIEIDKSAGITNTKEGPSNWGISRTLDFNTVKNDKIIEKENLNKIKSLVSQYILENINGEF
ncbi:hypothetical protein [Acetobacter cerevisiae]|uniref:hypothetical protein n=1 Tax=Acetobacter cerevisiae TaxID=178900 RepID=UPI00209DB04D|nr:hypothetical protein [Acetobacter cerevisiae]MCP1271246.1 hypothetical protein [Acetobacter cerevisiae]MCP1279200.1 hypothetical protein [Acetobacter cerevisiae]